VLGLDTKDAEANEAGQTHSAKESQEDRGPTYLEKAEKRKPYQIFRGGEKKEEGIVQISAISTREGERGAEGTTHSR